MKVEKLMYSLLYAIKAFDCHSYPEPYKQDIFNLYKEIDIKGYEYSEMIYNTILKNGYDSKEDFKKSMLIVLNLTSIIWQTELKIKQHDPLYDVFKNIIIT